jgi:ligand-binding sensor domain-containing protein/signal transduction histidine kinase
MRKAAVNCLCVPLIAWMAASAAQLPVKTYTTADGLARNTIECIVQDPRGFLWFCTTDGLSRFDGYTFTNYGTEHGLPNRAVTSLLISRRGIYWVGTWAGLFRFDPNSSLPQKFDAVRFGSGEFTQHVAALVEDRVGTLWVATNGGLYRLKGGKAAESVDVGIPAAVTGTQEVSALLVDRRGMLWIGGVGRVHILMPDGRTERYQDPRFAGGTVVALYEDREGRIWASDNNVLYRLNPNAGPEDPIVTRTYTMKDGLPGIHIASMLQSSDGRFWAGGSGGLGEYIATADKFESYTTAQGLSDQNIYSMADDTEGNLWVGTAAAGVMKIARRGFMSYTQADGLSNVGIVSVFVDQEGELCGWARDKGLFDCFDGKRFTSFRPEYPDTIRHFGWGWNQTAFQDHAGEWWVPTGQGLCRFGKTKNAEQLVGRSPKAVYTTRDGLPGNDIFRLFEDSRGDIWLSTAGQPSDPLTRWERATGQFHIYTESDGLPRMQDSAMAFAENRSGQLWIGFYSGGLARFRDGHFAFYNEADGVPAGQIRALHMDQSGRLWIASYHGGLGRMDNPSEANPRFVAYTTADGLSDNSVLCVTEDEWGRIYACTGHGIDRLDPATGHIKQYTTADGLARGEQNFAGRDRHGAVWFGSLGGLSRLVPEFEKPVSPPPVLITGLQIRAVSRPLAEFGQSTVSGLVLQPDQNQLRLDFVGLGFAPGERLRYQYRLEGADRDWSSPTEQRTINYASLRRGSYTFRVRAVNVEGAVSPQPASVTFTVLAPVWQRWWFLSAAGIALSLMIHGLYRYRLAQLLAVERIRIRIATDLHDDIGASLSHIAVLSEVVTSEVARLGVISDGQRVSEPLARIGSVSRELIDSMSDIVWAISPRKDRLRSLTQRMREFAGEILSARGIEFYLDAPDIDQQIKLDPEVRRQIFLIFKECVNNVVRHSRSTRVACDFRIERGDFVLRLSDNGHGFGATVANGADSDCRGGHGLVSITRRVEALGGKLEVTAARDQGVTVLLRIPHHGGFASPK